MTQSYYRVLKWTCLAAMAASLGTACVVSTGDGTGDDTDIDDGGSSSSGKTSSQAGKSGGGTGGKGGTGGSGGTGSGTAGSSDGGTEAMGGTPSTYVAGLCEEELGTMTSSDLPSCAHDPKDDDNACLTCMKAKCCTEWQVCYGKDPTTACGWGATSVDDLGQFDCIQQHFTSVFDGTQDEAALLIEAEEMCLNQCEGKDDFATTGTNDLVTCTRDQDNCLDECYPLMP